MKKILVLIAIIFTCSFVLKAQEYIPELQSEKITVFDTVDMDNGRVINLSDGINPSDAVNKQQLDSIEADSMKLYVVGDSMWIEFITKKRSILTPKQLIDPLFLSSVAANITADDTTRWANNSGTTNIDSSMVVRIVDNMGLVTKDTLTYYAKKNNGFMDIIAVSGNHVSVFYKGGIMQNNTYNLWLQATYDVVNSDGDTIPMMNGVKNVHKSQSGFSCELVYGGGVIQYWAVDTVSVSAESGSFIENDPNYTQNDSSYLKIRARQWDASIAKTIDANDTTRWAQGGISVNYVTGPASATDGHVVLFNGETGKIIKDSGLTLSGSNTGDNATNSQYSGLATSKQNALNGTGFVKASGTTISYDNSTYLTSLSGAVLTDQTSGQTIGATGARLTKLWATDITCTNAIAGSITGNAATATKLATARAIYGNDFDGSAAITSIIASTYGGTGNGFTKFTGATTSEKTYTLPNSNATLLYSGGALGTPSGGILTNCTFPSTTVYTLVGTDATKNIVSSKWYIPRSTKTVFGTTISAPTAPTDSVELNSVTTINGSLGVNFTPTTSSGGLFFKRAGNDPFFVWLENNYQIGQIRADSSLGRIYFANPTGSTKYLNITTTGTSAGNIGIGVGDVLPLHKLSIIGTTATNLNLLNIVNKTINKNTTTLAESRDSASFNISSTTTGKLELFLKSPTGITVASVDSTQQLYATSIKAKSYNGTSQTLTFNSTNTTMDYATASNGYVDLTSNITGAITLSNVTDDGWGTIICYCSGGAYGVATVAHSGLTSIYAGGKAPTATNLSAASGGYIVICYHRYGSCLIINAAFYKAL